MRLSKRAILSLIILLAAIWPFYSYIVLEQFWAAFALPALFIVELSIFSWPWRTVPLRMVIGAFVIGATIIMGISLLIQPVLVAGLEKLELLQKLSDFLFNDSVAIGPVFVAPVTEEILKVAPLIVILLVGPWKHMKYTAGPLDFALLGAALGGGFEFSETIMQKVGQAAIDQTFLLPTLEKIILTNIYWFGHAGTAAVLALSVGLAIRFAVKRKIWWVLPCVVASIVIFEHLLVNQLDIHRYWFEALAYLDGYGMLSAGLFIVGVVASMVISGKVLSRYRKADPDAALSIKEASQFIVKAKKGYLAKAWYALFLLRLRRALAYSFDYAGKSSKLPKETAIKIYAIRENFLVFKKALLADKAKASS